VAFPEAPTYAREERPVFSWQRAGLVGDEDEEEGGEGGEEQEEEGKRKRRIQRNWRCLSSRSPRLRLRCRSLWERRTKTRRSCRCIRIYTLLFSYEDLS
jgi:hypothetical protein